MRELSKSEKLRITRLGRGLTLKDVSKKVFLSESFIHLMEKGERKVPDDVEKILNFDDGIKWYQIIVQILEGSPLWKDVTEKIIKTLNTVLKI